MSEPIIMKCGVCGTCWTAKERDLGLEQCPHAAVHAEIARLRASLAASRAEAERLTKERDQYCRDRHRLARGLGIDTTAELLVLREACAEWKRQHAELWERISALLAEGNSARAALRGLDHLSHHPRHPAAPCFCLGEEMPELEPDGTYRHELACEAARAALSTPGTEAASTALPATGYCHNCACASDDGCVMQRSPPWGGDCTRWRSRAAASTGTGEGKEDDRHG